MANVRGRYSVVDDLMVRFYDRFLLEKYHVSDTFNDFVNSILADDLVVYMDDYRYTGWNFVDKRCMKFDDMCIGFPIYMLVVDDYAYPYVMSIQERDKNDETWDSIYLTLNLSKLDFDEDGNISRIDTGTQLFHECRHCLEMYVTAHNTITDRVYVARNDAFLDGFSDSFVRKCMRVADLFVASEQRARIDATVHYLKSVGGDGVYNVDDMQHLIEISKDHNLIYSMQEELDYMQKSIERYECNRMTKNETDSQKDRYNQCMVIGYIYQTYGGNGKEIDFSDAKMLSYDDRLTLLIKVFYSLSGNYTRYFMQLSKAIYVHLIQQSPTYVDLQTRLRQFKDRRSK